MTRPSQALNQDRIRELDARAIRPLAERFWEKVEVRGEDECWPWKGAVTRGRGGIGIGLRMTSSHRVAVVLSGRDIPAGMMVDHMCRNGLCQNPKHLRVVTPRVNSLENSGSPFALNAAKTHCPNGHPYEGENGAILKKPVKRTKRGHPTEAVMRHRVCLICKPGYRNSPHRVFETDSGMVR